MCASSGLQRVCAVPQEEPRRGPEGGGETTSLPGWETLQPDTIHRQPHGQGTRLTSDSICKWLIDYRRQIGRVRVRTLTALTTAGRPSNSQFTTICGDYKTSSAPVDEFSLLCNEGQTQISHTDQQLRFSCRADVSLTSRPFELWTLCSPFITALYRHILLFS